MLGLLFALSLLLGALLVMTRQPPAALPPARATLVPVPLVMPDETGATLAGELAGEIVQRPLFWRARRPLETETASEPVVVATGSRALDDVRLVGLFSSGDQAGVILRVAGDRRRLLVGEQLDTWTLDSLDAKVASFSGPDGRRRRIELEYAGL